jgi:dTDP-4-dehydrorhamnose 3,5-epimerase
MNMPSRMYDSDSPDAQRRTEWDRDGCMDMVAAKSESPTIDKFIQDAPRQIARSEPIVDSASIDGVVLERLSPNTDERGELIELLTTRDGPIEPIVHVYQVIAAPGSLRGWVYHKRQHDRLLFTLGDFEVQLFDIRPDSPTFAKHMVLRLGAAHRRRLTIPPLVAHSVRNAGDTAAAFVNAPTRAYDPADPDKFRYHGSVEGLGRIDD